MLECNTGWRRGHHECGHALCAIVTGGRILEIGLSANEGGHALTSGGWSFLIMNGGYLGSLVAGMGILFLSRRPGAARGLVGSLALLMGLVTLWLVRPILSFGFLYGVLASAGLLLLGWKAPAPVCWFLLRLLGIFSVLYALLDIRDDILSFRGVQTDASMLADATGIPAILWGVVWGLLGVGLLVVFRKRLV